MNTRSRLFVTVFTVLVLIGAVPIWFVVFRETHKPHVERPVEPIGPAEPVHEGPKTLPELLVGKWQLVKHDPRLPKGFQVTVEYTWGGRTIEALASFALAVV